MLLKTAMQYGGRQKNSKAECNLYGGKCSIVETIRTVSCKTSFLVSFVGTDPFSW
jgi:hypothetical protein